MNALATVTLVISYPVIFFTGRKQRRETIEMLWRLGLISNLQHLQNCELPNSTPPVGSWTPTPGI
jgi:hypothetical protein